MPERRKRRERQNAKGKPSCFHDSKILFVCFVRKLLDIRPMLNILFIFIFLYIHTFIQSQFIRPSPFAEASLHFFIACMLSGEDLPVVPSRESNPGLPYSKPTRCQLSHAAP
jgi:hypothetical protein